MSYPRDPNRPSEYQPNRAWIENSGKGWATDTAQEFRDRILRTPITQFKCYSCVDQKTVDTFRPKLSFRQNTIFDEDPDGWPSIQKATQEFYPKPEPVMDTSEQAYQNLLSSLKKAITEHCTFIAKNE